MANTLVTVDNNILVNLLNDARFRAAFPIIGAAQTQLGAPSCCKQKAQIERAQTLQGVRRQIVALPATKKLEFKRFLNAQRVRISATGPNNRTTVYTF